MMLFVLLFLSKELILESMDRNIHQLLLLLGAPPIRNQEIHSIYASDLSKLDETNAQHLESLTHMGISTALMELLIKKSKETLERKYAFKL